MRVDCWLESVRLAFTLQFTHGAHVARDITARLFLVLLDEVVDHAVIEVLTTKMSITSGGQYFKDAIVNRKKRNVERASTKVVNDYLQFATLIEAVCNSGSRRLVDDTENLEASNGTSILSSLTL